MSYSRHRQLNRFRFAGTPTKTPTREKKRISSERAASKAFTGRLRVLEGPQMQLRWKRVPEISGHTASHSTLASASAVFRTAVVFVCDGAWGT